MSRKVVETSGIARVNSRPGLVLIFLVSDWQRLVHVTFCPQPHAVVQSLQLWWVTGKCTKSGTKDAYKLPRVPI